MSVAFECSEWLSPHALWPLREIPSSFLLHLQCAPPLPPPPLLCAEPDLILCRALAGTAVGRLCEKCDGKCPICDSYVRPTTLVRICATCDYGSSHGRCILCSGPGFSDAYYCRECTQQEKDRDGCPKLINLSSAVKDRFYEAKKYGFKK